MRYVNEYLTSEQILKLMEDIKNRIITLKECLTFATPEGKAKQYVNLEKVTISKKAMGKGTTFDRIVIFEGDKLPKSMNSEEENYKHFEKSLVIYDKMAKYLEKMK